MNFKSPWTNILLLLAFILAVFVCAQTFSLGAKGLEGFQQMNRFEVKRGGDSQTYDDFYADIHDKLYRVAERTKYESEIVFTNTQMDEGSRVLELGCGTGHLATDLAKMGVQSIVAADRSKAMATRASSNIHKLNGNSNINVQVKVQTLDERAMEDPMQFEKGQFTHILALNRELYKHKDKIAFFRKCNHWLVPGGYLIVHILDPMEFDAIVPLAKTSAYKSKSRQEVKMSVINMIDMEYKNTYEYDEKTTILKQVETMTDGASGKVRQNEHAFFMDNRALQHAQYAGFSIIGEYTYENDNGQRIVIMRKM